MLLKALALAHQGPLQDHAAFFVTLAVFRGELIDPAQFAIAVFAAHVSNHVAASEHDPVLHFTVLQINYLIKKKGSSSGPGKPSGDELRAVGKDCIAVCTRKQASTTNVIKENSPHRYSS